MQLVSTFAYVYFKDVLAPLESVCYLGHHAWYVKENDVKQSSKKKKKKKKENRNKQLGQIQTQYAKSLYSK